jgi:nitroreductase
MFMSDIALFDAITTMRAMRRLKPDPVPLELIRKVLDAGTRAPSGQNTQPWAFVVIQDFDGKKFIQERYHRAMLSRFAAFLPKPGDRSPNARIARAAMHLAEHMHEVPVLLLVCGLRDWPFSVPKDKRVGKAPPSYGSIYPCVQNILLACRGLGLGASLTTMHQLFEEELHERFGIPEQYGVVALIPIGFPQGKFGPVSRRPAPEVTYFDRWGQPQPS